MASRGSARVDSGVLVALRTIAATVALAIFACAIAASPETPKKKAKTAVSAAAQDKRGTQESPLAVQIVPAPEAEAEANQDEKERIEKAVAQAHRTFIEDALTRWTRFLFVATAALAFVAVVQAGLFVWQLRLISKGTEDAGIAARAAKLTVETIKEEFVATHRPRIRVRSVVLDIAPALAGGTPFEIPGGNKMEIVNVGGTRARIEEFGCKVRTVAGPTKYNELPTGGGYEGEVGRSLDITLDPGESTTLTIPAEGLAPGSLRLDVYVLGWIGYSDTANPPRIRHTGFCRKYDPIRQRFFALNDEPDYEYED